MKWTWGRVISLGVPYALNFSKVFKKLLSTPPVLALWAFGIFFTSELVLDSRLGFADEPAEAHSDDISRDVRIAQINKLLAMPDRPTLKQMEKVLKPWPKTNPILLRDGKERSSNLLRALEREAPKFIAQLEKFYSDSVYVPMGRDIVDFGDILDGFFRSQGQVDRVRPMRASGNTIRGASTDALALMMKGLGMNFEDFEKNPRFILLDATTFHEVSQLITVLRDVYQYAKKNGIESSRVLEKIHGFGMWTEGRDAIDTDPKDFFSSLNPNQIVLGGANQFLRFDKHPVQGELMYTSDHGYGPWHTGYLSLERQEDGTYHAKPGSLMSEETRLSILYDLYEIRERTRKPEFLRNVASWAHKLGYKFSIKNVENREVHLESLKPKKKSKSTSTLKAKVKRFRAPAK